MSRRVEKLIEQSRETDKQRKIIENKMLNYNQENLALVADKLKKHIEEIGGSKLELIAETINPPQITFRLNDIQITTECIYDWSWTNIKNIIDANVL